MNQREVEDDDDTRDQLETLNPATTTTATVKATEIALWTSSMIYDEVSLSRLSAIAHRTHVILS